MTKVSLNFTLDSAQQVKTTTAGTTVWNYSFSPMIDNPWNTSTGRWPTNFAADGSFALYNVNQLPINVGQVYEISFVAD